VNGAPIWQAQIWLSPGAPTGHNLSSSRRDLVPRLARGRPAAAWPGLVSALFSLCGQSHRLCAELAIAAARSTAPDIPVARNLQLESVREHLRRILLDWPRLLAADDATQAQAHMDLLDCPWPSPTAPVPEALPLLLRWLERRLLGQPPAEWLANWHDGGEAWLGEWCRGTPGWLPSLLHRVHPCDRTLALDPAAALPADGPVLAALFASAPPDPMLPLWQGHPAHTGPWSRRNLHGHPAPSSAWACLGARLAEVIALCLPDAAGRSGSGWLAWGGETLAPGHGLGWAEMARGLLLHEVRLEPALAGDGAGHLAAARVIAPTEWNFHPEGVAAAAIAHLPAAAPDVPEPDAAVGLLMAALDPCVPYTLGAQQGEHPVTGTANAHPAVSSQDQRGQGDA